MTRITNNRKISDLTNREVFQHNLSEIDEKKIKVLLRRFQQFLGPINALTAETCSEIGPFKYLT